MNQLHGLKGCILAGMFLCLIQFLPGGFTQAQDSTSQKKVITVTGKVNDETGKPLPGISIQVKDGSSVGVTKEDGSFRVSVAADATLVFSYVGYNNLEQPVEGKTNLTVTLQTAVKALNDVIVVGYGSQKKKDLTGAVATFDTKTLEEKPIARIDQAMIGQMAGVQVKQQTGMPGAGLSIQVRGAGSVSAGNEPLYVIDGFPLDVASQNSAGGFTGNPLNNLNPSDIESIQVLKDAAAGAIYGSRAANGVVIITTKKGKIGKSRLSVNAYTGMSQVAKKLDVLSAQEWIDQDTELTNYKWVRSGTGRTADQTNAERRAILGLAANAYNPLYMTDDRWTQPGHPGLTYVDWQKEAFRKALFQNYEVSGSGGNEYARYFVSGNFLNQDGTLINSGYKNYSTRANVEITASKKLKLGINLAPSYSETKSPGAEGKDNQLMKLYNMTPIVEDTAGLLTGAGKNNVYTFATSSVSPVAYLQNTTNLTKTTRILFSIYGEYQIMNGLAFKTTFNYDDNNMNRKTYTPDYVAGNITNYLTSPGKSSSAGYNGFKKQNIVSENTLTYNTSFADKHNLNVIGGMSYGYVHYESFTLSSSGGLNNNIVQTLNNAATVTGNTSESNSAMVSYYSRVQYNYDGKYLVSATVRKDASSRFGSDSRWGTFPSASIGWRISQESFMKNVNFVNDLKLRASWGKSGNNNIGDYSAVPTLSSTYYSFGGTVAPGQAPASIPNPALAWETSNTYDLGVDAALLNNRINITVDAYLKKNTNLLLNVPVPGASGFTSLLRNIGAVENKGLEIGINTNNLKNTSVVQWTTQANIAFNTNHITALGPDGAAINVSSGYSGNPPFLLKKGVPMFSYYLIQTDGILTAKDIADPNVAKLAGQEVGDTKYVDAKKDGVIDANDRVVAGRPTPKYTWGLTNTLKYKNWDLSIQAYGQQGGSVMSWLGRAIDNPANGRNTTLGVWRDRWTEKNQNYSAPRGKIGTNYTIPYFTTDWLYKTDFIRIQNITLGYNLKNALKTSVFSAARVYASAQNFFGHDKYKGGVNPEAQNTNTSGNGSYPLPGDYGAMPLSKTITLGVNLTF
ncbi:TonB-linked outer membrane protein, SusC/RagA family [Filimonas lacunae]|uniref:TonB-linked outer membrane protein, SusC/RagA family n=1 Tax=Filimonas lacunae TaxID=477680 RepID=A0A173MP73_9BACT|nr:TonB-dependent receptor [Filimonas lacunae]BAV09277.1 outer membrane protein, nutrient binding [Filimonas lacunae]SIS70323.1 TonB-linked outer membrane protein, SusC/RagA family [Filimonas lacunae]